MNSRPDPMLSSSAPPSNAPPSSASPPRASPPRASIEPPRSEVHPDDSWSAERLVSPRPHTEDSFTALRPQTLDAFTGQEKLTANLSVFLESAQLRDQSLDHVLLSGPPGLGKTSLARIVANELGTGFRAVSGPNFFRASDLAAVLTNLNHGDVLFIDEIHRLPPPVEEILYLAMEDRALDLVVGEGAGARSVRLELRPFTLIGATTRSGLISRPLRERFGILLELDYYSTESLADIARRAAPELNFELAQEAAAAIARRSRGTPRVALRFLRRARDFAPLAPCLDADTTNYALERLGVDELGLDEHDRRYLQVLAVQYAGGPAGLDALAATLGCERDVLEDVIEPFLLRFGLIMRTPRGRALARLGWEKAGHTPPAGARFAESNSVADSNEAERG